MLGRLNSRWRMGPFAWRLEKNAQRSDYPDQRIQVKRINGYVRARLPNRRQTPVAALTSERARACGNGATGLQHP